MQKTTRTIAGTALQVAKNLGIPYTIEAHSTLNEKFEIQNGVLPSTNEIPSIRFFCIGKGGHRASVGTDGTVKIANYDYDPSNAALYDHLPFVLRPVLNDLPIERRVNYALRKRINVPGRGDFFAYYLKKLDLSVAAIQKRIINRVNGVESVTPFVYDSQNLSPAKPTLSNTTVTQTTGSFIHASTLVPVNFDAFDVAELKEVCKVLYGDEELAIVSEVGLVSAVERQVTGQGGSGENIQYQEAIAAQLAAVIPTFHALAVLNNGFLMSFDLGEKEPMITASNQTVV